MRRHSSNNHMPVIFFRNRVVPSTPPSLVKFIAHDSSVMTGAGNSMPMSDHVPDER